MDADAQRRLRILRLSKVFRPAAPVDVAELFQGRIDQLARVNGAIHETGRHALVYGEQGVGKTSLAAVSMAIAGPGMVGIRINCDYADTYASLVSKLIERMTVFAQGNRPDAQELRPAIETAVEILNYEEPRPARLDQAFSVIAEVAPALLVVDEFNRVRDEETRILITDTIKTLSDQLTKATLVLVGVADDVESLVAHHGSITRNLAQIRMPRMEPSEIVKIVENGYGEVGLDAAPTAMHLLKHLPQGLPAYAHQLAQSAGHRALVAGRDQVEDEDVRWAMAQAIANADESITRAYLDATTTSHRSIYPNLLLACALAPVDEKGMFAPNDLRSPLQKITGEAYEIDRFQKQLVQLCEERGPVLERKGGDRKWRYRFIDPMMRPHIIMRAYNDGVSLDALTLVLPPVTESGQLFSLDSISPQA